MIQKSKSVTFNQLPPLDEFVPLEEKIERGELGKLREERLRWKPPVTRKRLSPLLKEWLGYLAPEIQDIVKPFLETRI